MQDQKPRPIAHTPIKNIVMAYIQLYYNLFTRFLLIWRSVSVDWVLIIKSIAMAYMALASVTLADHCISIQLFNWFVVVFMNSCLSIAILIHRDAQLHLHSCSLHTPVYWGCTYHVISRSWWSNDFIYMCKYMHKYTHKGDKSQHWPNWPKLWGNSRPIPQLQDPIKCPRSGILGVAMTVVNWHFEQMV